MAGGMPYVFAENPFFTVLANISDRKDRVEGLRRLVRANPMWLAAPVASYDNAHPVKNADDWTEAYHLRQHWFGFDAPGPTTAPPAPPKGALLPTTGWWANWYGDAHEVVRQTLQRLYQVSLGVPGKGLTVAEADAISLEGPKPHPMRIVWMCGAPTLQGFVFTETSGSCFGIISTPHVEAGYWDPQREKHIGPVSMVQAVTGSADFRIDGQFAFTVGHTAAQKVEQIVWAPQDLVAASEVTTPPPTPVAKASVAKEIVRAALGFPLRKYAVLQSSGPVITAPLVPTP